LLEVAPSSGSAQSTDQATGPFTRISVTCLDHAGNSTPFLDSAGTPVFPIGMMPGHTFEISSGKHRVKGMITASKDCDITVLGTGGTEPNVEARNSFRNSKQQRRYIISNAPSIDSVEVNVAGPAQSFPIPAGTLYTAVILS
jgi:hypothetical protein